MAIRYELRQRGRGMRKCRICGGSRALIRSYKLYICRRCFKENAERLGFEKLS